MYKPKREFNRWCFLFASIAPCREIRNHVKVFFYPTFSFSRSLSVHNNISIVCTVWLQHQFEHRSLRMHLHIVVERALQQCKINGTAQQKGTDAGNEFSCSCDMCRIDNRFPRINLVTDVRCYEQLIELKTPYQLQSDSIFSTLIAWFFSTVARFDYVTVLRSSHKLHNI